MKTISVKLKPNAKVAKIEKISGSTFIISTKSPAIENKANLEARELLSKFLTIPKTKIILKRGAKSREKVFEIL